MVAEEQLRGYVSLTDPELEALVDGINSLQALRVHPRALLLVKTSSAGEPAVAVRRIFYSASEHLSISSLLRNHVYKATGTFIKKEEFAKKYASVLSLLAAQGFKTSPGKRGELDPALPYENAWPADVVAAVREATQLFPLSTREGRSAATRLKRIARHILRATGRSRTLKQVSHFVKSLGDDENARSREREAKKKIEGARESSSAKKTSSSNLNESLLAKLTNLPVAGPGSSFYEDLIEEHLTRHREAGQSPF